MEVAAELMEHKQRSFEVYFRTVLINKARSLHKKAQALSSPRDHLFRPVKRNHHVFFP